MIVIGGGIGGTTKHGKMLIGIVSRVTNILGSYIVIRIAVFTQNAVEAIGVQIGASAAIVMTIRIVIHTIVIGVLAWIAIHILERAAPAVNIVLEELVCPV